MPISSAGIGSGLDVNSIVSQLVAADRAGADKQLAKLSSAANSKISALGTVKGAMSALQDAATALSSGNSLGKLTAQSGDSTVFTASASTGSSGGRFDIEVVSLATATKLASAPYASAGTSVGSGTVTLGVGSDSFTVTLTDGANSLANLRDAINNASDNKGVNASIVTDVNGAHLVLLGTQTGVGHAVTLTSASSLNSSPFVNTTQTQAAASAHLRIDGADAYSDSNSASNIIDGVTLNLVKANPGSTVSLSLSADTKSASDAVQQFVNTYNAAVAVIGGLTKYDATNKTSGALIGDPAVRGLMQQLRTVLGSAASGTGSNFSQLSDLGITTKTDGTLVLDSSKLGTALSQDVSSVQKLLGGTGGYSSLITSVTKSYLGSGGQIDAETTGLQSQLKDVQRRTDALNTRMTSVEARYRAQFTALDTMISQMKSTQDYLTQQLSAITNLTRATTQ